MSGSSSPTSPTSPESTLSSLAAKYALPTSIFISDGVWTSANAKHIDQLILWVLEFEAEMKDRYAAIDEKLTYVERLIELGEQSSDTLFPGSSPLQNEPEALKMSLMKRALAEAQPISHVETKRESILPIPPPSRPSSQYPPQSQRTSFHASPISPPPEDHLAPPELERAKSDLFEAFEETEKLLNAGVKFTTSIDIQEQLKIAENTQQTSQEKQPLNTLDIPQIVPQPPTPNPLQHEEQSLNTTLSEASLAEQIKAIKLRKSPSSETVDPQASHASSQHISSKVKHSASSLRSEHSGSAAGLAVAPAKNRSPGASNSNLEQSRSRPLSLMDEIKSVKLRNVPSAPDPFEEHFSSMRSRSSSSPKKLVRPTSVQAPGAPSPLMLNTAKDELRRKSVGSSVSTPTEERGAQFQSGFQLELLSAAANLKQVSTEAFTPLRESPAGSRRASKMGEDMLADIVSRRASLRSTMSSKRFSDIPSAATSSAPSAAASNRHSWVVDSHGKKASLENLDKLVQDALKGTTTATTTMQVTTTQTTTYKQLGSPKSPRPLPALPQVSTLVAKETTSDVPWSAPAVGGSDASDRKGVETPLSQPGDMSKELDELLMSFNIQPDSPAVAPKKAPTRTTPPSTSVTRAQTTEATVTTTTRTFSGPGVSLSDKPSLSFDADAFQRELEMLLDTPAGPTSSDAPQTASSQASDASKWEMVSGEVPTSATSTEFDMVSPSSAKSGSSQTGKEAS